MDQRRTTFILFWILFYSLSFFGSAAQASSDSTGSAAEAGSAPGGRNAAPAPSAVDASEPAGTARNPTPENPEADAPRETPAPSHEPDRRWIIKGKSPRRSAPPARPQAEKEMEWENPGQREACTAYLEELRDSFRKAQYYSIQGDSCVTAEQSDRFLSVAEKCRKECPEGFLEHHGFKPDIVRNLNVLKRLGNQRCLRR
ncbi:MAG: hypothetical protein ACOWWM_10225 [Desulfobacterales bacterium]